MSIITDGRFDENLFEEETVNLQGEEKAALASMQYGDSSSDNSAIIGRENYIFIYDGSNKWSHQISGSIIIDDADLERTCRLIDETEQKCNDRNIALSILIVPEKDIVYPEYSPNCDSIILTDRSVHRLIEKRPSVLYPWEGMLRYKHCCQLYHKLDSHHGAFGGFVIANSVLKSIRRPQLLWEEVRFTHRQWQDDLSVKWFTRPLSRRTILEDYRETSLVRGNPLTGTHIKLESDIADNDDTAIIYGDSYSWNPDSGLSRFLLYRFRTVHFIWNRIVDWRFIDQVKPQAIIVESAERFLIGGLVRA